jgi:hypothetical protein
MRTKAFLLAACVGALGSVSSLAQTGVYSLNAVGYITLSLPPRFSMIADQLQTTNNTIGSLMNDANGYFDGVKIYAWNGSSYAVDTGDSAFSPFANGWDNSGVITLNPGQAAWFWNPKQTNMNVVFQGNVPTGTLATTINGPGVFNMISSPVPVGGDVVTNSVMNLINYGDEDAVYVYSNPGGYQKYTVDFAFGIAGYQDQWDPPGDPIVAIGQGFWYQTSQTTATFTWTEVFSVNQ